MPRAGPLDLARLRKLPRPPLPLPLPLPIFFPDRLARAGVALALAISGSLPAAEDYAAPERVGSIRDDRLEEVSGIVPVTGKPGCFWVHNDSGDKARIFAIRETGRILARVKVPGAEAKDWEDIADGPAPGRTGTHLYIADVGNNKLSRKELAVYRIPQPEFELPPEGKEPIEMESEKAQAIRFRYPDKPFDCEAIFVHPSTARLYLITKSLFKARVFSCDAAPAERPHVLVEEAVVEPRFLVTAADLSADGRRLLVRTYLGVEEYRLPEGKPFAAIFSAPRRDLPRARWEIQGEAICHDHEDRDYLTVNEGKPLLIHRARRLEPPARKDPDDPKAPPSSPGRPGQ